MKNEIITFNDPKSPIAEVFKTLRTNMQFMSNKEETLTLLVTSTVPGEGKSWVTSNLAVAFAQTGKKVVIIDSDMRKGRLHNIFEIPIYPGLSNYLAETEENNEIEKFIYETEVENLSVIPAGNVPPNPSELLSSEKMVKGLEELKEKFDIILFDSTPCMLVTDAVIISRIVDYTIIVSSHKTTKIEDLKTVQKNIENVGGKIAGVVINKVLLTGDNGCGGDIWLMRNKKYPDMLAEESVSIRAVRRVYSDLSGQSSASLSPKDIYDIAEGIKEGDSHAAIASFNELGIMAGAAIASVLNVVDGLVVIGGGVSGASKYILPALITELRAQLTTFSGNKFPCVSMQVYNGEDESERARFLSLSDSQVVIPGTHLTTTYHQLKQTLVLCSKEGASRSIMRGAYAYALQKIDLT